LSPSAGVDAGHIIIKYSHVIVNLRPNSIHHLWIIETIIAEVVYDPDTVPDPGHVNVTVTTKTVPAGGGFFTFDNVL